MIKEKTLKGKKYNFKHMAIEVVEKDKDDNVVAFTATFVHTALPGEAISDGLREVNQTLWDQSSPKRPKGFLVKDSYKYQNGLMTTLMVSTEWFLETLSKEARKEIEFRWDAKFKKDLVES
ncbi:hypothetical protein AAXE64_27960 [Priestia megaterium]